MPGIFGGLFVGAIAFLLKSVGLSPTWVIVVGAALWAVAIGFYTCFGVVTSFV